MVGSVGMVPLKQCFEQHKQPNEPRRVDDRTGVTMNVLVIIFTIFHLRYLFHVRVPIKDIGGFNEYE